MCKVRGNYRIVSDGTAHGTKVYDPAGEPMPLLRELTLRIHANEPFVEIIQLKIGDIKVNPLLGITELDVQVTEDNTTVEEVPIDGLLSKGEEAGGDE